MTASWAAAAEQLADDAREPGFTAAETDAAAWQARCLPEATRGLMQAAHVLTCGDAGHTLWGKVSPSPSAIALLDAAEELEGETAGMAEHGRDMAAACEDTRDRAIAEYEAARRRLDALQRIAPATEEAQREIQAQIAGIRERLAELARVIGDCEAALDLLAQVTGRLDYALNCFRRVPDDLAEAYDVPLAFIRDGGTLPWSGDFLTGTANSAETIMNGAGLWRTWEITRNPDSARTTCGSWSSSPPAPCSKCGRPG